MVRFQDDGIVFNPQWCKVGASHVATVFAVGSLFGKLVTGFRLAPIFGGPWVDRTPSKPWSVRLALGEYYIQR